VAGAGVAAKPFQNLFWNKTTQDPVFANAKSRPIKFSEIWEI